MRLPRALNRLSLCCSAALLGEADRGLATKRAETVPCRSSLKDRRTSHAPRRADHDRASPDVTQDDGTRPDSGRATVHE